MTARKAQPRAVTTPKPTPVPAEFLGSEGSDMEAPDAIAMIRAAADQGGGGEWQCLVYQVFGSARDGVKQPWLFNVEVDELKDLRTRLQEQFPEGGKFKVVCRLDDRIFKSFVLEIARRPGAALAAAPAAAPADSTLLLLKFMEESERRQQLFIEKVLTAIAAPAAVASPAVSATASLTETLNLIKTMQETMPKPDPDIGLKMFEKGMELASKFSESHAGPGIGWMDLAKEFLGSEGGQGVLRALIEKQPAQNQQRQNLPNPNAQPAAQDQLVPTPAQAIAGGENFSKQQRDTGMAFLIDRANAGGDPKMFADWITANMPEAIMQEFEEKLLEGGTPKVFEYIVSLYPTAAAYRDWFLALIAETWDLEEDAAAQDHAGVTIEADVRSQTNAGPAHP